jgi:tetratricopeptide (TPR) repeat protein
MSLSQNPVEPSSAEVTCPECHRKVERGAQYCAACGFPLGVVAPRAEDRFIGAMLGSNYRILELIGVGGMGRVYRAEQSVLGRTVAVKIVHPYLLADESSVARFLTEARAASQLNHPNSISVFDFGRTDDGQPYLVMEFLKGQDLAQVLTHEHTLPLARIVDIILQVLAALGEAHALGIVHRDLKPENIVIQPQRRGGELVKVLDFGLAKVRADATPTNVTSPGIVCGTPDYMAPEQGRGDEIDGRSDLYAVGVILFQLLTGKLPFEGESPTQVVMMHLSVPAPDPRQVSPRRDIPASIAEVVKRALAKAPRDRYEDAQEFAEALTAALGRETARRSDVHAEDRLAPSLALGEMVDCEACEYRVPLARYCCECATPLPDARPDAYPLPFVGRREELAFLMARRPSTVTVQGARIVGEPGIGKSRLLEEFTRALSEQDYRVVLVEPDPYRAKVAYTGLATTICGLFRLTHEEAEAAQFADASADVRRGLLEIFSGPQRGDSRSPMDRKHCLSSALRYALAASAKKSPAMPVILLEDMDQLDGPSLQAFQDLLEDPPGVAALIVGTHIPNFDPKWNADRSAMRALDPLDINLVRPAIRGLAIPIHSKVLPLYLDQAVRFSVEGATEVPERLADVIAQRLDLLDAEARRILQGLSVLGQSSPISTIAELVRVDGADAPIQLLQSRGIISVANGVATFGHSLWRGVVLASTPIEARRQLHRQALRIEDKRRGPLEVRAFHAYQSDEAFQALLLLEQVADRATAVGDTQAEVYALRLGLNMARREIARGEIDDPMRAVLIFSRKLGASLIRAGDYSDADGVLSEALDLAGPASADRAKILGALAHVSYGRRRYEEAQSRLDAALEAARAASAPDLVDTLEDTRRAWAS